MGSSLRKRLLALDDRVLPRRKNGWRPQTPWGQGAVVVVLIVVILASQIAGLIGSLLVFVVGLATLRVVARWDQRAGAATSAAAQTARTASDWIVPPDVVALAVPATRREVLRLRWRSWLAVGIGAVLFVSFIAIASKTEDHETALNDGGKTTGTVSALVPISRLDTGGGVRVRYRVASKNYTELVTLDDGAPTYRVGERVTVEYDRAQPSDMTLPGQDNESVASYSLAATAFVLGLVIMIGGAVAVRRSRLRRGLLKVRPWQLGSVEVHRGGNLTVDSVIVRPAAQLASMLQDLATGPAWYVRDNEGRYVVASTSGTNLLLGRRPKAER